MSERIIVDLRRPLRDFVVRLNTSIKVPDYVLDALVMMVFDILIYEMEEVHDEPELSHLGKFYETFLVNNPLFYQRFTESFFLLLRDLAGQLKSIDVYSGDGFSYVPEKIKHCRSIVVRKFDDS